MSYDKCQRKFPGVSISHVEARQTLSTSWCLGLSISSQFLGEGGGEIVRWSGVVLGNFTKNHLCEPLENRELCQVYENTSIRIIFANQDEVEKKVPSFILTSSSSQKLSSER